MLTFSKLNILSFGFLTLGFHVLWVNGLFEFICTDKGLFTPYIHVYKGRKGPKIHSSGPGFFDVQDHMDLYICVNGPAFFYYSLNYTSGETFDSPEFNISVHLCATYNKSPKWGHNHPSIIKRLHGVLLMGDPEDYRSPSLQLLPGPMWNYNTQQLENGTSLIKFGDGSCHLNKKEDFVEIKSPAFKTPDVYEFCMRVFGEDKPEEEEFFRADPVPRIGNCTGTFKPRPNSTLGPPGPPTATAAPTTAAPTTPAPPGRRKRAAKAYPLPWPVPQAPANTSAPVTPAPSGPVPPAPTNGTPGAPARTPPPAQIELKECEPLPTLAVECDAGKPKAAQACGVFKSLLGAEDVKWPAGAEWRQTVLDLIVNIFGQTCTRVSKGLARKVTNIIKYYLVAALTAKPGEAQRDFWKFIIEELNVCKDRRVQLVFSGNVADPASNTYLKKGVQATQLSHYLEEAENEFAFNWAIDMNWKIFSTVLGICTPGSSDKKTSISSRFYTLYVEDFLNPVNATWVEYKDNLIFQFILGEYYHGDSEAWMNNCLEASFIESDSGVYRPIRPVLVNDMLEDNYFLGSPRGTRK